MAPTAMPLNITVPYTVSTQPDYSDGALERDDSDGALELAVADFLFVYPAAIFLVLGTIGNALSFLVFSRPAMRASVTSVFFRVLAVTDTLVLWSSVPVFILAGGAHYDLTSSSRFACKFLTPFLFICCYTSCWILVLICVDRFIGIYFPHKYMQRFSRKRACVSIVALCVLFTLSVGAYLMTIFDIDVNGKCGVPASYVPFFTHVWRYLDLVLLNLVPTLILVTLNAAIIVRISRAVKQRKLSTCSTQSGNSSSANSSATAILLSVSVVYVLCTIPSSTKFLVTAMFGVDAHGRAQAVLYERACLTLYLFNHAVNFFLYCAHGSTFQRELRDMLRPRCVRPPASTLSTELSIVKSSPETV